MSDVRRGQLWMFSVGGHLKAVVMVLRQSGQRFTCDMMDDDEVCHESVCVWSVTLDEIGHTDIWSVGMRYARKNWHLISDVT